MLMPPSRHAFTIIELLVVIAIIVVLAGLLFPAISMARNAAQRAATSATMGNVEAAISRFRIANNGVYPLDPQGDSNVTSSDGTAGLVELAQALATIDGDTFGPRGSAIINGEIVDAWDQPLRYRHFMAYPQGPYYDVNPDSYQLWSIGRDGICAVTTHNDPENTGDNITNWGRR